MTEVRLSVLPARGKQPMDELGFPADKEVEKITDLPGLLKAA